MIQIAVIHIKLLECVLNYICIYMALSIYMCTYYRETARKARNACSVEFCARLELG